MIRGISARRVESVGFVNGIVPAQQGGACADAPGHPPCGNHGESKKLSKSLRVVDPMPRRTSSSNEKPGSLHILPEREAEMHPRRPPTLRPLQGFWPS